MPPLLQVPPRFARGTAWGAWVRFPLLAGGTLRRGLSGILVFVNFGCAIGKCLRDMISTSELGQTRGSAPTETPLCKGNPLWLPPARRVAHVENLTHRHLLQLRACAFGLWDGGSDAVWVLCGVGFFGFGICRFDACGVVGQYRVRLVASGRSSCQRCVGPLQLKGVGFLRACLLAALPSSASLPPCERDARAPSTRDAGNAGVPPAVPTAREKNLPL